MALAPVLLLAPRHLHAQKLAARRHLHAQKLAAQWLDFFARLRCRLAIVLVFVIFNTCIVSAFGFICKYSRSPRLRQLIGAQMNYLLGEHLSHNVTKPTTSPAVVAHQLGNATVMECWRYRVHGDDDDLTEQNLTMTIVRIEDNVIVYNPIPLSRKQMEEHVLDEAACRYFIVLPSAYHHLFVDAYVAFLPPGRVEVVGAVLAGQRHDSPLHVHPPSHLLSVPNVQVLRSSSVADEINVVVPLRNDGDSNGGSLLLVCHLLECRCMVQARFRSRHWALRAVEWAMEKVSAFDEGGGIDLFFWAHMTDANDCMDSIKAMLSLEDLVGVVCSHGGLCGSEPREMLRRHLSWI